jgi:hypothetical protein
MTRWISLRYGLSLGCLAGVFASAQAGPPVPTKVDCGIEFRCNVLMGPQAYIPRAPWYTYFPADPNLLARAPGTTPYPTWPNAFPPPAAPAPTAPAAPAPGPMTYQYPSWNQVQTVGYSQVPSYWYGR